MQTTAIKTTAKTTAVISPGRIESQGHFIAHTRASTLRTLVAYHSPPRDVVIPRALSAPAMPFISLNAARPVSALPPIAAAEVTGQRGS